MSGANHSGRIVRDTVGATMVEAIIVIPVLLLLWAGVLFMFQSAEAAQRARATARQCAWEYANAGCDGDLPDECVASSGGDLDEDPEVARNLRQASQQVGGIGKVFDSIFGKTAVTSASETFSVPELLGGGAQAKVETYAVMCNEAPRKMKDVILDAFCSIASGLC